MPENNAISKKEAATLEIEPVQLQKLKPEEINLVFAAFYQF